MSLNKQVKSLKCKSCGAPLTLHGGGHKIRTLNCQYCGTTMDVQKDFTVLARHRRFNPNNSPDCPLDLGMEGEINGVHFTIIGMVGWASEWNDTWLDLLLFSPTHGYTWLSYNRGHYVFSRRVRDIPDKPIVNMTEKEKILFAGREYRFFERYKAKITWLAGELTWKARIGDSNTQAEAIDPPYLLSTDSRKNELEYYVGEYMDAAYIHEQFAAPEELPVQRGVHPAQPYHAPLLRPLGKAAGYFALFALGLALLISIFMGGSRTHATHVTADKLTNKKTYSETFNITKANRLVKMQIHTRLQNAWAYYDIAITKDNKNVLALGKEVSYYSGYDGGEHWSEGDSTTTALFTVPEAGKYKLNITQSEGGTGYSQTMPTTGLTILVHEGYVSPRYFYYLVAFLSILALFYLFRCYRFEKNRWADVLED